MIFVERIQPNYEPDSALSRYTDEKLPYFFDIETTGLSKKAHYAYLIGALSYTKDGWLFRQWMAENADEEEEILRQFNETLSPENILVHYNGSTFDIPFLNERFRQHGIVSRLPEPKKTIDLYRLLIPVGRMFRTDNCKQPSMETLSGYPRTDRYSGGELVQSYAEYVGRCRYDKPRAEELLKDLLLHNSDDIMGLADIPKLLHYLTVFEDSMQPVSIDMESTDYVTFKVSVSYDFPKEFRKAVPLPEIPDGCEPLSETDAGTEPLSKTPVENLYLSVALSGNEITVVAPIYRCTAYYYYPNYKEYYYLPLEKRAIHKSLGAFVDKQYREPATKDNARQAKCDLFLPQISDVITPAFRFRFNDRMSLFACRDLTKEPIVPLTKSWLSYVLKQK